MSKLSKSHMPGWVSNGNVQINVGRDLHIHGGGRGYVDMPDDCAPRERSSLVPGLAITLFRVSMRLFKAAKALVMLALGLVLVCAWVVFGTGALALWALGRIADIVHFVERTFGGAPTQLVYVPSILQPREPSEPVRMLGPGARVHELADINERDSHYVDN